MSDLVIRQLRVHRKRENFPRQAFRHRGRSWPRIASKLIRLGEMKRNGIVNTCSNPTALQKAPQIIAPRRRDDKQMKHVLGFWWQHRQLKRGACQQMVVFFSVPSTKGVPTLKVREFHQQDRCLDNIQARVRTD